MTSNSSTRVRLGKTELQVSPVCFGTWQLSPKFWGEQDEKTVISAPSGINLVQPPSRPSAISFLRRMFANVPRTMTSWLPRRAPYWL